MPVTMLKLDQEIINLLHTYKVLRFEQIVKYFYGKDTVPFTKIHGSIIKLRDTGIIHVSPSTRIVDDHLVCINKQARLDCNEKALLAFNVLLQFEKVKFHYTSDFPFILFLISRNDMEYHMLHIPKGEEALSSAILSTRPDISNIIAILDDKRQLEEFKHPKLTLVYAPCEETNTYKLYKVREPEN